VNTSNTQVGRLTREEHPMSVMVCVKGACRLFTIVGDGIFVYTLSNRYVMS
jgi:hypothetical protein